MVKEGAASKPLPWEVKALDGLELPKHFRWAQTPVRILPRLQRLPLPSANYPPRINSISL
jgi:hypothetical protein